MNMYLKPSCKCMSPPFTKSTKATDLSSVGLILEADGVVGHLHLEAAGGVVVLLGETTLNRILRTIYRLEIEKEELIKRIVI